MFKDNNLISPAHTPSLPACFLYVKDYMARTNPSSTPVLSHSLGCKVARGSENKREDKFSERFRLDSSSAIIWNRKRLWLILNPIFGLFNIISCPDIYIYIYHILYLAWMSANTCTCLLSSDKDGNQRNKERGKWSQRDWHLASPLSPSVVEGAETLILL